MAARSTTRAPVRSRSATASQGRWDLLRAKPTAVHRGACALFDPGLRQVCGQVSVTPRQSVRPSPSLPGRFTKQSSFSVHQL